MGGGLAAGGVVGMVAVPVIGTVSRKLAARLTLGKAKFADAVVRAGRDGQKITDAYLRHTPKKIRAPDELAELLLNQDVDLSIIKSSDLTSKAVEIVRRRRELGAGATAGSVGAVLTEGNEQ